MAINFVKIPYTFSRQKAIRRADASKFRRINLKGTNFLRRRKDELPSLEATVRAAHLLECIFGWPPCQGKIIKNTQTSAVTTIQPPQDF